MIPKRSKSYRLQKNPEVRNSCSKRQFLRSCTQALGEKGETRTGTECMSQTTHLAPACIISTAQHASPKVIGHRELRRPQLMMKSILEMTYSARNEPNQCINSCRSVKNCSPNTYIFLRIYRNYVRARRVQVCERQGEGERERERGMDGYKCAYTHILLCRNAARTNVYVCVPVCKHVCMYVCMYAYMHVFILLYVRTYRSVCMYKNVCMYVCVCVYTDVHECTCKRMT